MSRSDAHRLADMIMAADEIVAIFDVSKAMPKDVIDVCAEFPSSDVVRNRLRHH